MLCRYVFNTLLVIPLLEKEKEIEVIEVEIPYKVSDEFRIYPLGDIHLGSIHCAEKDIVQKIEEIKNIKNSIVIGMGDYCDCILANDKRFDIGGLSSWLERDNIIDSQKRKARELFLPVKDKVKALLTGNHEETIHQKYQNNITRNLCEDLGVPYGGYSCFLSLSFTKGNNHTRNYIIHAWHGSGSAQTEGARLMRLMSLVNEIQAHIYLMGHLHAMTQHTPDRLLCVRGRIKSIKLAATLTGSWLKAYTQPHNGEKMNPSYAEMKGYKPSRIGAPCIVIRPEKDEFIIES